MQNVYEKCDVEEFSQWGDVVIDSDLFCHRFVRHSKFPISGCTL